MLCHLSTHECPLLLSGGFQLFYPLLQALLNAPEIHPSLSCHQSGLDLITSSTTVVVMPPIYSQKNIYHMSHVQRICLEVYVKVKTFLPDVSATSDLLLVSKVHTHAMFIAEWLNITTPSAYEQTQVARRDGDGPLFLSMLTPHFTLFV